MTIAGLKVTDHVLAANAVDNALATFLDGRHLPMQRSTTDHYPPTTISSSQYITRKNSTDLVRSRCHLYAPLNDPTLPLPQPRRRLAGSEWSRLPGPLTPRFAERGPTDEDVSEDVEMWCKELERIKDEALGRLRRYCEEGVVWRKEEELKTRAVDEDVVTGGLRWRRDGGTVGWKDETLETEPVEIETDVVPPRQQYLGWRSKGLGILASTVSEEKEVVVVVEEVVEKIRWFERVRKACSWGWKRP